MSDFIQKLFTTRQNYSNGDTRIGEQDRIWYDSITNTFRISDGSTPGGVIITGGGGGGTGPKGDTGTAATITVGTVSVSTTTATVTNVGTLQSALFNFVLQQGPQGLKGDTGTFTGTLALTDLSDVNIVGIPSDGHVLKYDAGQGHWAPAADLTGGGGGGLSLSDLDAVVDNTPSGNGSLAYNDTTGVFTYTPPDLSPYLTSVDANNLSGTTLKSTVVTSSLTSLGTLTNLTVDSTSSTPVSITATGRPGSDTNAWSFVSNQNVGGPRAWIQFPDSTLQTTAWTGSVSYNDLSDLPTLFSGAGSDLTGTSLATGIVSSSLTSVGTLTGLTVGGTGGDLVMTGGAITGVGNITATGTVAVNAAGGITTTALAFDIVNGTATTVNIGGAATAVNIGSTAAGTLTVNNPTIVGSSSTQVLFNTVATTVNAFGVASALTIGATGGTLTLRNPTIVGSQTTQNLFNTVATTINAFGAATAITIGATTGATSIRNSLAVTHAPATATGYAIIASGKDTQGGTGYFDILKATNTTSGVTNPNKSFRLTSDGQYQIINSAYTANILNLTDAGNFSVPGTISVNYKQAVNGPAFSAYAAAILQTIPNNAQTKVLFQTEEFDTNSNYTDSRFTPTVEGYYQLNAEVRLDGASGTGEMMIILYKNGSEYKRGTNQQGTQIAANFWAMMVSSVAYANGTTDYFEIYVQQGSGSSATVTAVNATAITWFNGCMLRGA